MKSTKRKISVLTGTRADFGLLRLLMQSLLENSNVKLETIVTGTHFLTEHGSTHSEITLSGLPISHRVDILTGDDTPSDIARITGDAIGAFAELFRRSRPDILVVLGDRYEAFAATGAAYLMSIPVAHIAGGEITVGALDDALRHSITKMSSLHFTAAEEYRSRVIQLGEQPESVFNVGAIGLDNLNEFKVMTRRQLEEQINFKFGKKPFILCTVHPETATNANITEFFRPIAKALDRFPDYSVLITKANADSGGRQINEMLAHYAEKRQSRVKVVASLGHRGYLSALEHASVVLGNSSSGILEAPTAGTPTVNIGDRQLGRLRAPSVIDVENNEEAIVRGINKALSSEFQKIAQARESPYGHPGASIFISNMLATTDIEKLLPKKFYDIRIQVNE